MARSTFLAVLLAAGAVLMVMLYEVPQPWRGYLVACLLVVGSLGMLVLRFAGHYLRYKSLQLNTRPPRPTAAHLPAPRDYPVLDRSLKVVVSHSKAGRHTLR